MTKKVLALLLNRPEINHYQSISFTRHLFYFYANALKQTWFVYFIYAPVKCRHVAEGPLLLSGGASLCQISSVPACNAFVRKRKLKRRQQQRHGPDDLIQVHFYVKIFGKVQYLLYQYSVLYLCIAICNFKSPNKVSTSIIRRRATKKKINPKHSYTVYIVVVVTKTAVQNL